MSTDAREPQAIYEADSSFIDTLNKYRERILNVCTEHLHKPVRVHTTHGQHHEGIIVHIDAYHIYLQLPPGHSRALIPGPYGYPPYNPYYNNVILPLALFDLLAISLLL
ncbi:hypothetical protein ACVNS2_08450 [Paenibacillus caseinilyticus]|uniref:Uncharacterized protein n=1 Tax=Paenibacillus mucilaginosus K02 TaxID=997761 RepID=I0BE75_9BACL|nr:hypothetical protein [Paenibacillus mucilaginosus]AFH60672.1 hypothetical protein B2K_08070 [Paenibacillus mucilaginosus K02]